MGNSNRRRYNKDNNFEDLTKEVDPIKAMIEKIEPRYQIEDLYPPTINMFK